MSSVVKKASHFTPKLKKNAVRRKVNNASDTSGGTTPTKGVVEAGGIRKADTDRASSEKIDDATGEDRTSLPSFNFEMRNKDSSYQEEDIDPRDTSAMRSALAGKEVEDDSKKEYERNLKVERDEEEEDEEEEEGEEEEEEEENLDEFGDIDIFKKPGEHKSLRRKSSVHAQRRLSGVTPISLRKRSESVSLTQSSSAPPEGTELVAASPPAPVKIGIPVSKPSRRKLVLAGNKANNKKSTSLGPTSISILNESPEQDVKETKTTTVRSLPGISKFIMGIDPKTNKLRKYRADSFSQPSEIKKDSSEEVEEVKRELRHRGSSKYKRAIPIAPEDLETRLTSIKQLPRRVNENDLDLLSQVSVHIGSITMADLCKPTLPIGETSEKYQLVKEAQEKIRKQKLRKRVDRMRARKERKTLDEVSGAKDKSDENERRRAQHELLNLDAPQSTNTGLKLTMQNGKVVVDEESTIVNRHRNQDNSGRAREESNPFENPITSSTYSKRKHTDRWTLDELKQFYNALSTWGTDFTFIAQLFPYRTRKQIKLKFNLEEKKYPEIIEMALKRKLPADFDKYCDASKNKIQSLEYYNEELKQLRVKHEQHMALIVEERQKALKEDAEANRRMEVKMRTGSKPMTRSEKLRELRKNEMVVGSIDDVKKQRTV